MAVCLTVFLKKETLLEAFQEQGDWPKEKSDFITRDQLQLKFYLLL